MANVAKRDLFPLGGGQSEGPTTCNLWPRKPHVVQRSPITSSINKRQNRAQRQAISNEMRSHPPSSALGTSDSLGLKERQAQVQPSDAIFLLVRACTPT